MCGISALYRYTSVSDQDREKLIRMNAEMVYRGPDENGIWSDEKCCLAHTRLSIIGLENGRQPLFSEDKNLVLVSNGEVYNHQELKDQLISKGHIFSTGSDSETILHLYEEYGVKCLQQIRGMFAFCLYDQKSETLFVARDRVGEKPLYYSEIPEGVVLCSELKTLARYFLKEPEIDLDLLYETIRYSYPLNRTDTFIQQAKRLEPGNYLLISRNGLKKKTYWPDRTSFQYDGESDIQKKTLEILRESISLNLRSDVPVAILLSSGIDSCAIAALAKESGHTIHAVTAGYKGDHDGDEREIARKFSKEKAIPWQEIELDQGDYLNLFEEYTQALDEPVADVAAFAQWSLYRKTKELGFKVILTGIGGDELFYGYPSFNKQGDAIDINQKHLFDGNRSRSKSGRIFYGMMHARHLVSGAYARPFLDRAVAPHFVDFFYEFNRKENGSKLWNRNSVPWGFDHPSGIEQVYQHLFNTWLPNNCLYLSDRMGMGNSVEVRSPFVDFKLVEWVNSIPLEFRYRKNQPKYLLKSILKGILPEYILNGTKKGFTPPQKFIDALTQKYQFRFFKNAHPFYNAVLADKIVSTHYIKNSLP